MKYMPIKNPLRYPGAKSKLSDYIQNLILLNNLDGCTFYEPYAGSAAISFKLLENDIVSKVKINELDPLIYYFWLSVMHYTEDLIDLIRNTPVCLETWHEKSLYRNKDFLLDKAPVEIGFAGLFLNRTNFSGILKANPLGGLKQTSKYTIDCRYNKDKLIKSISQLSKYRDKVDIYNLDAITFMQKETRYKRNHSTFVYIDPPYFDKGPSLYRYSYNTNMHHSLSTYIKRKGFPWLISYDDQPEIRKMYKSRNQQQIYLDYSVKTSKKGRELLISNLEIPPAEAQLSFNDMLIG
ncbi:DNA adenine methylase [Anaerostipes hominis (ex Lee et al. 2021)]|uniref:DNA adenine methylase n=1 Tax=Anaerostipes hominis (ex Lee et al. 2021) TaxID=2025494 RepID=UPI0022E71510|nr:DNA adenine methylase [Anaerostipes hominis (ex Lee et al. 2021)]